MILKVNVVENPENLQTPLDHPQKTLLGSRESSSRTIFNFPANQRDPSWIRIQKAPIKAEKPRNPIFFNPQQSHDLLVEASYPRAERQNDQNRKHFGWLDPVISGICSI